MNLSCLLLGAALMLLPAAGPTVARPRGTGSLALALDLVAAALAAGQSVPAALEVAAPAAPESVADELLAVAAMLRLGADPPEAWAAPPGAASELVELRRIAGRSGVSGARLADALRSCAARLRRAQRAADEARAQRASVWCAAPLALCFLPAFVCLGIVPTLIGLGRAALHTAM